ncbi:MAG: CDP-alcohol phosphatidyltransferase family protein [Spirochaetota bacterium]|jgi:phosphatidylglycerophosphate synthase|nr:CDP-alcohol phosphatidyltransferase family protein [Spirochaetota bacterium]
MEKIEKSPLDPFVKWFFPKLLPFVPQWMSANAITSIGIVICFLAGVSLVLTGYSFIFYYTAAILFFLTWVTDTLDGVVARARNQQSRLGHYLDHYGDSWAIIFIGLGLYLSKGSHVLVGLICCVIYLMLQIDGHIKVQITNTLELPAFGPTEIRLVIFLAMIFAAIFDPGAPLSWWPEITGESGWLTQALGLQTGMTFLDVAGIFVCLCCAIGLIAETWLMIRRFGRMDRGGRQ